MNCGYYALISSASLCGGIEKNTLHIVQGVRELFSPSPSLPPLSALLLPVSFSLTQTIQTGRWRRSYIVRLVKREFVHKTPMHGKRYGSNSNSLSVSACSVCWYKAGTEVNDAVVNLLIISADLCDELSVEDIFLIRVCRACTFPDFANYDTFRCGRSH